MNIRRFSIVPVTAAILLASAARLPAPITVPPEETQPTRVVPPEEAPKKKKAESKPAAPTDKRLSFAGNWTGITTETFSNGRPPTVAQTFVNVSNDEKTVKSYAIIRGGKSPVNEVKCQRDGNTLLWQFSNSGYGNTFNMQMTMTLKSAHQAVVNWESLATVGPTKGNSSKASGTLTR